VIGPERVQEDQRRAGSAPGACDHGVQRLQRSQPLLAKPG
jgi:hypothetical protein